MPRLWPWPVRGEAPSGHPKGWACFAIDRPDEASAFADELARRIASDGRSAPLVVHHPSWAEPGLAQWGTSFPDRVAEWARSFSDEMQGVAGFLDDEGLATYLDLRRALADGIGDDASALSVLAAVADLGARADALEDGSSWTNDMLLRLGAVSKQAENVRIRMETVEVHRLDPALVDPDTQALAGLVGGM